MEIPGFFNNLNIVDLTLFALFAFVFAFRSNMRRTREDLYRIPHLQLKGMRVQVDLCFEVRLIVLAHVTVK